MGTKARGQCQERRVGGNVPVFGLLKRGGKVYTQVTSDARASTLMLIIRDKDQPDGMVYPEGFRSYDVLDVSIQALPNQPYGALCAGQEPYPWD